MNFKIIALVTFLAFLQTIQVVHGELIPCAINYGISYTRCAFYDKNQSQCVDIAKNIHDNLKCNRPVKGTCSFYLGGCGLVSTQEEFIAECAKFGGELRINQAFPEGGICENGIKFRK